MGDRRIADRRAPEEGVLKIETKKLVMYCIIILVFLISVICNIVLGSLYSKYKKSYDALTSGDEELVIDDEGSEEYVDSNMETSENSCTLTATCDKEEIKAGESGIIEVTASNIVAGNGIVMLETLLDYDEEKLECEVLSDDDIEWSKTAFTENYLTMSRKDLLPSSEDQVVAKIKVKVKDNTEAGSQTVTLSQVNITMDDEGSFQVPDEIVSLNIVSK